MSVEELRQSPMMSYLMDALDNGEDIGHYGQLAFAIVARFFLSDNEVLEYLQKSPNVSEEDARTLLAEVKQKNYNPPQRGTILEWQQQQDFQICPEDDPDSCNVYKRLKFPDEVYEHANEYARQKANL